MTPAGRDHRDAGSGSPAVDSGDDRLARARAVLDDAGIRAPVRAVGVEGAIAAVQGPPALRAPLARLAPELRGLGFQYVALEITNDWRDT